MGDNTVVILASAHSQVETRFQMFGDSLLNCISSLYVVTFVSMHVKDSKLYTYKKL